MDGELDTSQEVSLCPLSKQGTTDLVLCLQVFTFSCKTETNHNFSSSEVLPGGEVELQLTE